MIIKNLVLRNFRNYDYLNLSFEEGINLIVGENGEGKTNIVEAIHFLSLARSFRTQNSSELIKETRQFATIEASIEEDTTNKNIVALLTPSIKKIQCNKKQIKKISELSNLVNVIVFEPKDSLLFNDSPSVRRNYLDVNLSKKTTIYLENLMIFEKLLKERNAILKNENVDITQLDVVTEQLINVQEIIVEYRMNYINEINTVLSKIIKKLGGESTKTILKYTPFVELGENFKKRCFELYKKNQDSDILHHYTQNGIHREDFTMEYNNKDVSSYGSQGENRLSVIALKLAPYFLIDDKGKKPIVILDDVMSELDTKHQEKLIAFVSKMQQVFITATNYTIKNTSIYEVKKHTVTRRNA